MKTDNRFETENKSAQNLTQALVPFKMTRSNSVSDRKDNTSVLLATNDQVFAKHFGLYAEKLGLQIQYVWSLEGIDFLPLWRVGVAVVTEQVWQGHEIFGRPVAGVLQGFKKIFVLLAEGSTAPFGNETVENVEYVDGLNELKRRLELYVRKPGSSPFGGA